MINLKDVTFKTKVQAAIFFIAAISTILIANDLYHFYQLSRINEVAPGFDKKLNLILISSRSLSKRLSQ